MKIVINTAHQRFGGGVQVALSFIHECRKFDHYTFYVWVGPGLVNAINSKDFPANFHFEYFDFGAISIWDTFKINKTLKRREQSIKPDCVISTTGPTYYKSQSPQIIGYNLPLYIYPESPYIKQLPLFSQIKLNLKKLVHFYFFKRDASAYLVQTDDVNNRVRNALKTKDVYTVTNTYSSYFGNSNLVCTKLQPKKKGEIRLLTVSSWYPHKNLDIIKGIVKRLKKKQVPLTFVLTLRMEDYEREFDSTFEDYIINVGPVSPEECPSLYSECDFMFLPTLAECFSASYPEAMKMERPIITTDLGFARSICGEAAIYFEPANASSATKTILCLMNDKKKQRELVANGKEQLKKFDSASHRALKYLEICERVVSKDHYGKN